MGVKNVQHCHTMYSINDSALSPQDLVAKAKELGVENIALTDHGTLLGINRFMSAGEEFGINTIPGVEAYCNNHSHLILIPKNYKGFQSISHAMRDANQYMEELLAAEKAAGKKKPKGTPIMMDDILVAHFKDNPDIIATSACVQGVIASILLREQNDKRTGKQRAILEKTQQAHDIYLQAQQDKKVNAGKLKDVKSHRTQHLKYKKPAHQTKMQRLKDKLDGLPSGDRRRIKYEEQLIAAQNAYKMACELLPEIEKSIASLEFDKMEISETIKRTSSDYKKYEKAKEVLGELPVYDEKSLYDEAKDRLLWFKSIFSNFYIEIQNHGLASEAYVMPLLVRLARETDTPLIAANDAHMVDGSEKSIEARRIMRYGYFQRSQTASDADRELYLKTDEELSQALSQVVDSNAVSEAIENLSVLESCKVELPHESHYPAVKTGATLDDLIERKKQRMIESGEWADQIQQRVEYELHTIKTMGFEDYHLVVEDFCRVGRLMGYVPKERRHEIPDHFHDLEEWVKRNDFHAGVGIGPGRGSAAGSKVCNIIGITNIDPIAYDLLFQRFLNPERVSMPDIDTDIAAGIRSYLIMYLKWRYAFSIAPF